MAEGRIHGLRGRWPLLVPALASVVLAATALLVVRHIKAEAMGQWRSSLEMAADDRRESIDRALAGGVADARTLAAYPTAIFLAAGKPDVPYPFPAEQGPRPHLQMLLSSYLAQHGYRAVWLLDRSGRVLAAAGGDERPDGACRAHAMRSMQTGAEHLDVHRHPDAGTALAFAAPVRAVNPWAGRAEGVIGALALEASAEDLLVPLLKLQGMAPRTGETVLARRDGEELVFLLPTHAAGSSHDLRVPADTPHLAAAAAIDAGSTFGEYRDYRGRSVLAATRRLGAVPWALVVKVDRAEALGPAASQAAAAVAVALALVAGTAGVAYGLWRARRARDLTLRRREEDEKRWLLRVIEQSPVSILITDTSGAIQYVNPRFTAVSGYTAEEVLGHNPRLLKSGQTPPEVYRDLWARVKAGEEWQGELLNRRKDGSLFWEEARISGVRDADGEVTHFVAVKEDVSARREAQRALREAQDQLIQSQKMEAVGKLAGGVAHDFNNLLGVILGYAQMLARTFQPGEVGRHRAEQILKASQRAAALTRQLLAFSRRQVLQPRPVDLAAAVSDIEPMLRRLLGEDVQLAASGVEGEAVVMVDPGQLDQVLMNLAVNARDAMPRGGRLTVAGEVVRTHGARACDGEAVPDGAYAALRVSDEGTGIAPEVRDRIFEPFFTTKPSGEGTGLGLATVYGIVKQSGGYVTVDSEVGRGSTFTVLLPLLRQPAGDARPGTASPDPSGSETVLLVEDQQAVREVIADSLRQLGYEVLEASSGEEALDVSAAQAGPIALLVADVVMPGINGIELAQALRARRPGLRVLFISGYPGEVLERHGGAVTADVLLHKPFTAQLLAGRIRAALDAPAAGAPA